MKNEISVLLVEDHALIQKMVVLMLRQLKCKVDAVSTGQMAIEYATKNLYDIILMDIGLPDIDGIAVIGEIRNSNNLNYRSPIVALTAHSDQGYRDQSYQVGANDFVVKPFDNEIGAKLLKKYTAYQKVPC